MVDTDYFNGTITRQTEKLDSLLDHELLGVGDLILTEVLQGFDDEQDFEKARNMLTSLTVVELGGRFNSHEIFACCADSE